MIFPFADAAFIYHFNISAILMKPFRTSLAKKVLK